MKLATSLFAGVLAIALMGTWSTAADKEAKTVTGKSSCATCDGITKAKHEVMLVDKDGMRWVLVKDKDAKGYEKAHDVRKEDKKMTATLSSEPQVKKDDNGKEYKEVKVSEIKIEA
jgi:hypothetical protein